jgi:hypothetical protein
VKTPEDAVALLRFLFVPTKWLHQSSAGKCLRKFKEQYYQAADILETNSWES